MFKNIQHRLTPEFGGVITDAGIVVNDETSDITIPTNPDNQEQPVYTIDDDVTSLEKVDDTQPHTLTIPTLFTDWFCFDFSRTAPLFERFSWGDNTYFQLDAQEVVEQLMSEYSFVNDGYYAYYKDDCLYLGYIGNGVRQIHNFGWSALSEIPFRASTTHTTDYRSDMQYDTVSFKAVSVPSSTNSGKQAHVSNLSTTEYTINFLDKQPTLTSFIWDGEEYYGVDANNLNEMMQASSSWVDGGMFSTVDDNVLTISTTNEYTFISSFAWSCEHEVKYKEKDYGEEISANSVSYSEMVFYRPDEHVGKDVVAVREYNDGEGIWHRLVAIDELSDNPLTFTSDDYWSLPPSTTIQYKLVDDEMVWVISGDTPDESMVLEIAYINDTNIMEPTYLNGGESQEIVLPNTKHYTDVVLVNLVATKSIIVKTVNQ